MSQSEKSITPSTKNNRTLGERKMGFCPWQVMGNLAEEGVLCLKMYDMHIQNIHWIYDMYSTLQDFVWMYGKGHTNYYDILEYPLNHLDLIRIIFTLYKPHYAHICQDLLVPIHLKTEAPLNLSQLFATRNSQRFATLAFVLPRISSVGFVSFPDKDLDALQLGGTLIWGPPPEVRYNQER